MRVIAIGRAEDVRGFALAGVEIAGCQTERQADAMLRSLGADPTVGLVLVPAWIDRSAPGSIARIRRQRGAPVILVLPATEYMERGSNGMHGMQGTARETRVEAR